MRSQPLWASRVCQIVTLTLVSLTCLAADAKWIDVPFVRQVRAGCGAAAIAMVMQYWVRNDPSLDAVAADAEHINEALPASAKGLYGSDLKEYLEAHGFSAFVIDGAPADLENHLAKGRPVIVCLASQGSGGPLHFAVVVGAGPDEYLLNDPARGKLIREEREAFLRSWKATSNWALLAVPRPAQ